jgi:hypothetical protein
MTAFIRSALRRPTTMVSNAMHDRISGHANRVRVLDRFLTTHAQSPASGSPARTKSRLGRSSIATLRLSMNEARWA